MLGEWLQSTLLQDYIDAPDQKWNFQTPMRQGPKRSFAKFVPFAMISRIITEIHEHGNYINIMYTYIHNIT
jgi:hypothetical protein